MFKKFLIIISMIAIHFIGSSQTINTTVDHSDYIDSLKSLIEIYDRQYFKMELSFSGYESSSNESFYYDSLYILCAYHLSWNMEGTSGESFHWFQNGKLYTIFDEKQGQGGEPEATFLILPKDYDRLKGYELEFNIRQRNIIDLIDKNQEIKFSDNVMVSITIEESKNYGMEFTETTKVFIDKKLYEHLFE